MVRSVLFSLPLSFGLHTQLDASVGRLASLQKIEKEWQKIASVPDDNYHEPNQTALGEVTSTMNTVLDEVIANRDQSNIVLTAAKGAIDVVNNAYAPSYANDLTYHNGPLTHAATAHSQCRTEEDSICRARDVQSAEVTVCTAQLQPQIPECVCEVAGKNALEVADYLESCMSSVNDWSAATCEDGRTLEGHKNDLDAREATCTAKQSECHGKQQTMEAAWCSYYVQVHDTCDAHTLDYDAKKQTFEDMVASETQKAVENKNVCQSAKKVLCYVDVLGATGEGGARTVQDCQGVEFNAAIAASCASDAYTQLTEPAIPEMVLCDLSTLMDGIPGAESGDAYKNGNYNTANANRLTGALTVYAASSPLEWLAECPHVDITPIYPDATQPLGTVGYSGDCSNEGCGMCAGNCYDSTGCGRVATDEAGTTIKLVCVRKWMYGPTDLHEAKSPKGCSLESLEAAELAQGMQLGVCALPGDYRCSGPECASL